MSPGLIKNRRLLFTTAEKWFSEEAAEPCQGIDVLKYRNLYSPSPDIPLQELHTLLLDLSADPDKLMSGIHKSTRYKIRRAEERDKAEYRAWNRVDDAGVKDFCKFFNSFAETKGLDPLNRKRIQRYIDNDALVLSRVTCDGRAVSWHAYFSDGTRARLLHSASTRLGTLSSAETNMIGRAGRYQHWRDILFFKENGFDTYDFGGWYEGKTDMEKLKINKFKEEFGGSMAPTYYGLRPLTPIGRIYVKFKQK